MFSNQEHPPRHDGDARVQDQAQTPHLVDVFVSHWEGEGEAQRQLLVLDVVFVQKVGHTLCDVVKQLQADISNE